MSEAVTDVTGGVPQPPGRRQANSQSVRGYLLGLAEGVVAQGGITPDTCRTVISLVEAAVRLAAAAQQGLHLGEWPNPGEIVTSPDRGYMMNVAYHVGLNRPSVVPPTGPPLAIYRQRVVPQVGSRIWLHGKQYLVGECHYEVRPLGGKPPDGAIPEAVILAQVVVTEL